MFEFIPNKLKSREAFPIIDEFYEGWFTSRKIGFDDTATFEDQFKGELGEDIERDTGPALTIVEYFPGSEDWDRATLFAGLLWLYYNYPLDFLYTMDFKPSGIPGAKLYRILNFYRVACFLIQSGMDDKTVREILSELLDSNIKSKFYAVKDKKKMDLKDVLKGTGFPNAEEVVIMKDKRKNHPFGRKKKSGEIVPLDDLKKRTKNNIMFTEKAIKIDDELFSKLFFEFEKFYGGRLFMKERRDAKKESERLRELKRQREREEKDIGVNRLEYLLGLLDQMPKPEVSIEKSEEIPKVNEDSLRHKVTKKTFKPFVFEEIDIDIDPNIIADKINEISESSQKSKRTDTRSDFSTESFGVPSDWENISSSPFVDEFIEI